MRQTNEHVKALVRRCSETLIGLHANITHWKRRLESPLMACAGKIALPSFAASKVFLRVSLQIVEGFYVSWQATACRP